MKIKKKLFSIITLLSLCLLFFSFTEIGNNSNIEHKNSGTIYIVRHAEKVKEGENPDLTAYGHQRAQELANYLKNGNIEGMYATDFLRVKNTAKPLADKLGIEVEIYKKKKTKSLMKDILKKGGNHLVVGHWGTANEAFSYFKVAPEYNTEEANNDNRILKVTYSENKLVEVVLLTY
tara:strand:- start:2022 stop:2552 length:531 start_codon:yes stop_codon:yes gene_type:complete